MGIDYAEIAQVRRHGGDPLFALWQATSDLQSDAFIRAVNGYFRYTDESHVFPINGRFDVTERAIRRVRSMRRGGCEVDGFEYILALDQEISSIVNDERNW